MRIRKLSEQEINRIAAGEIIERPINIVKELVENAIDAKASTISITILRGGRNLILVRDNGSGIDKESMPLVVERHATSKLPEGDGVIRYLGFRGEALSSIAAVSRLSIRSKIKENDYGYNTSVYGGVFQDISPIAMLDGTEVEVRDLFYNIPMKVRFLKSERTETSLITDLLKRMAVAHYKLGIVFYNDDREIFHYKTRSQTQERLIDVFGESVIENCVMAEEEIKGVQFIGYIGAPTNNYGNSNNIHLIVNGRIVDSDILKKVVRFLYYDLIPQGRFPLVIMYINIDEQDIDVNVHPKKEEIRFKNEKMIREGLSDVIRKGLGIASKKSAVNIEMSNVITDNINTNYMLQHSKKADIDRYNMPARSSLPDIPEHNHKECVLPVSQFNKDNTEYHDCTNKEINNNTFLSDNVDNTTKTSNIFSSWRFKCQIHRKYIIVENDEGIIMIDQHAAHERILYEKIKRDLQREEVMQQLVLISEIIECSVEDVVLCKEYIEDIKAFGILIEIIGDRTIVIRSVPQILVNHGDIKQIFETIINDLKNCAMIITLREKIHKMLGDMGCKRAVKAGDVLTNEEIEYLISSIKEETSTAQCNHGRPTYIRIKLKEIDRLFER